MPVLHFAASVFRERGDDSLEINYSYDDNPDFMTAPEDEQITRVRADGRALIDQIAELESYRTIILIGKSLGTLAIAGALADETVRTKLDRSSIVWLTPTPSAFPEILRSGLRSIVVIGTDDPGYPDFRALGPVSSNITVSTIGQADHALERPGGTARSVEAVGEMVAALSKWVRDVESGTP